MYIRCNKAGATTIEHAFEIPEYFDGTETLPNGAAILFQTNLPDIVREFGRQAAAELPKLSTDYAAIGMSSPVKLSPQEYIQETERLADIAERCIATGFDWMAVLPLTRNGKLPKGRHIVVASSECVAVTANQTTAGYFKAKRLQLMLVPVWSSEMGFIEDDVLPDTVALVLSEGPISTKTSSIFDRGGNATAPTTNRSTYLTNDNVRPGSVYLSGKTQFLYLGRIVHPDGYRHHDERFSCDYFCAYYVYVKFTKAVKEAVKNCTTQEALYNAIATLAEATGKCMPTMCSFVKNPKKFTQFEEKVTDPAPFGSSGYHEFNVTLPGSAPERTWFVSYNDPNIEDGAYLLKP